jgi:CBS domain-containing protein
MRFPVDTRAYTGVALWRLLYKSKLNNIGLVHSMPLEVEDAMIEDVITVDAEATVKEAVEIMNKHEIGCLVVMKRNKLVGILTERDMLKRVLGESRNPEKTKVSKIMTTPVITTSPTTNLEEAAKLMIEKNVKKLPVVSEGKLVGIVTLTDLARFQPEIIRLIRRIIDENTPKRMRKVVDYYIV